MASDNPSYKGRIKQEADFWDERAAAFLASGRTPLWFDHRRGQDVTFIPLDQLRGAGLRANPVLYRAIFGEMIDYMLKEASQKKGFALDLGCGAGWFSLELARWGMNVDGFDISPLQIAVAKKMAKESEESSDPALHVDFGRTNYDVVDLNWVTLEKNKYEAVVSLGALHHIQGLDHLFGEIKKSLKSGGKFIFYEWVGYHGLSRLFPALFHAVGSLLKFWAWLRKGKGRLLIASPFEGISGERIIDLTRREFSLEMLQHKFLFLPVLISQLRIYRLHRAFSLPLARFLNWLDHSLNQTGLFKGPFVLGLARKNEDRQGTE